MRKLLSLFLVLAVVASPAAAQAKPDFSGTWSLDPASAPPTLPAGSKVVATIKQDDKTMSVDLTISTSMGEQKRSSVVNLDGSTTKNPVATPMGSIDFTSTFAWDGAIGVVTSKADIQGQAITQTDRWSLGSDGKTLRLESALPAAGVNNTLSFIKQP